MKKYFKEIEFERLVKLCIGFGQGFPDMTLDGAYKLFLENVPKLAEEIKREEKNL